MEGVYSYEDCKYLHKKLWNALGTMSKEELKEQMHHDPMFLKMDMVDSIVDNLSSNKEFDLEDITPVYDCWACEACSMHCFDCPIKWGGEPNRCVTGNESTVITAYDVFLDFLHIGTTPKWLHLYSIDVDYEPMKFWGSNVPMVSLDPDCELDPTYYDFHGNGYAKNKLTIDELVDIYYDEYVEACLWIRDAWK